jgi:hypothetical protein
MSRSLAALVVASCCFAPVANAGDWGGGGGFSVGGGYYPRYGNAALDYDAPGGYGCFGATGFGFRERGVHAGLRVGGEVQGCRLRPGVRMGYGGADVGLHLGSGVFSWGFGTGLGLGGLSDVTGGVGPYQSVFAYLKPEVRMGVNLGFTGFEAAVHLFTPVHLAQWVGVGEARGYVNPTVGFEVRFLFGRLYIDRSRGPAPSASGAPDPLAVPGPASAPPPDPGALPPDAPLAIPASDAGFSPEPASWDVGTSSASPSGLQPRQPPPPTQSLQPLPPLQPIQPMDTPAAQPVDGPLPAVVPAERLAPTTVPAGEEAPADERPLAIPADAE